MAITRRNVDIEIDDAEMEKYRKMAEEILRQGNDPELQARYLRELKENVARCEAKFGIPSEDIHDAIEEGRLVETLEVCDWIMDYNSLQRIHAAKR
jgi:hypothetical protein